VVRSNHAVSRGDVHETTIEDTMRAYDDLQPAFREMLRRASISLSAEALAQELERDPYFRDNPDYVESYMIQHCRREYFWPWIFDGLPSPELKA
jgi:hypothetical protein